MSGRRHFLQDPIDMHSKTRSDQLYHEVNMKKVYLNLLWVEMKIWVMDNNKTDMMVININAYIEHSVYFTYVLL